MSPRRCRRTAPTSRSRRATPRWSRFASCATTTGRGTSTATSTAEAAAAAGLCEGAPSPGARQPGLARSERPLGVGMLLGVEQLVLGALVGLALGLLARLLRGVLLRVLLGISQRLVRRRALAGLPSLAHHAATNASRFFARSSSSSLKALENFGTPSSSSTRATPS